MAADARLDGAGAAAAGRAVVRVVAGALFDRDRRVLIAQRPVGKHMAGRWELPGGKLEEGETPLEALRRELAEELGVELRDAQRMLCLRHDYADRRVLLDVWRVADFAGEPRGLDGQALEWVALDELPLRDILEADLPIVTALRLPGVACMAVGSAALAAAAECEEPRTLLWRPAPAGVADESARAAVRAARQAGHRVLVVGGEVEAVTMAAATGADGVLLEWGGEPLAVDARGLFLVGALCDSAATAVAAARAGAQFVVLAPSGGPAAPEEIGRVCEAVGVPVLAGWYTGTEALAELRAAGAYGCAVAVPPRDRAAAG